MNASLRILENGILTVRMDKEAMEAAHFGFKQTDDSPREIYCDFCEEPLDTGYYVPLLHAAFCPKCMAALERRVLLRHHKSDVDIEKRRYNMLRMLFLNEGIEVDLPLVWWKNILNAIDYYNKQKV